MDTRTTLTREDDMDTLEFYTGRTSEDMMELSQFHCVSCGKVLHSCHDHIQMADGDYCLDCI